jgi:hypothetical protein
MLVRDKPEASWEMKGAQFPEAIDGELGDKGGSPSFARSQF